MAMRERTLEALIGLVADDPPEALVEAEVRERLHDLGHRLQARRMTVEQFLEASGATRRRLLAEIRADAARAVRLDLALRALADAEDIQVSEEELDETVTEMAQQAGTVAGDLRRRLDRAGRLPAVRSDRRKAKALTWLFDHVGLVDEDGETLSRDVLQLDVGAHSGASGAGRERREDSAEVTDAASEGARTCRLSRSPRWRPRREGGGRRTAIWSRRSSSRRAGASAATTCTPGC